MTLTIVEVNENNESSTIQLMLWQRSEEEIKSAYNRFKEDGLTSFYLRLRTSYIQRQLESMAGPSWNETMSYFIQEEANDFLNNPSVVGLYYEKPNHFTKITQFLMAKLMMLNTIPIDFSIFHKIKEVEDLINNPSRLNKHASWMLVHLFMKEADLANRIFEEVLRFGYEKYRAFSNIFTLYRQNESITECEYIVESHTRISPDDRNRGFLASTLCEEMTILLVYNWRMDSNLINSKYWLMKLLQRTQEDHIMYPMFKFLYREVFEEINEG